MKTTAPITTARTELHEAAAALVARLRPEVRAALAAGFKRPAPTGHFCQGCKKDCKR
jgi:hypothetical protein